MTSTLAMADEWEGEGLPDRQWEIYRRVIEGMQKEGIRFALGGAFALATYSGYLRNTKDLDFYVCHDDLDRVIEVMNRSGASDYYDVLAYDRGWIYRGHVDDTIVDAIFGMPNRRATVERSWLTKGPEITLRGKRMHVIPPEALVFAKLFVMQRPRCDWPDIVNIIYGAGAAMDWRWLLERLKDDRPLLASVLSLFGWISPGRAQRLPEWLWSEVGIPRPADGPEFDERRVNLLDTRPWFAPLLRDSRDG